MKILSQPHPLKKLHLFLFNWKGGKSNVHTSGADLFFFSFPFAFLVATDPLLNLPIYFQ